MQIVAKAWKSDPLMLFCSIDNIAATVTCQAHHFLFTQLPWLQSFTKDISYTDPTVILRHEQGLKALTMKLSVFVHIVHCEAYVWLHHYTRP